jgi:hypothetical protein
MDTTAQYALLVIGMAAILDAILNRPVKVFSVVLPPPGNVIVRALVFGAGVVAVLLGLFVVPIGQVTDRNARLDIVSPEGETEVRRDGPRCNGYLPEYRGIWRRKGGRRGTSAQTCCGRVLDVRGGPGLSRWPLANDCVPGE